MPMLIYNGVVADTPATLTDRIRVSVPDLRDNTRQVYGPMPFDPIVSGEGGTRLPHAGDKAVLAVDEETGRPWVVSWHRDDTTPPPYTTAGGGGGDGIEVFEQPDTPTEPVDVGALWIDTDEEPSLMDTSGSEAFTFFNA